MLWAHRDANQKRPVSASVLYMPRPSGLAHRRQGVGQSVPAVAAVLVAICENFHCVRNPCSRSKVPQSGSLIHDRPVSCGVRVWHFSSRDQIELESGRAATTLIFGLTPRRTSAEAWPRASSPALPLASCPRSASAFPSARLPPCAASWRAGLRRRRRSAANASPEPSASLRVRTPRHSGRPRPQHSSGCWGRFLSGR